MKFKLRQPKEYLRWPMNSTRFLFPTIAIKGFFKNFRVPGHGMTVHFAFWTWQAVLEIRSSNDKD